MSFWFLYQTNQRLKEQTLTAIHDNNSSYINQLDKSLQQLYHMDYQLMSNYEWIQFEKRTAEMNDYERFRFINSLTEQLTLIKNIHPLLESVHIYFPEAAAIYHSSPYAYGSFTILDESKKQQYKELFSNEEYLQYYTDPISEDLVLSLIMEPKSPAIDYKIIFTLSVNALQRNVAGNSIYSDDYYYFTIGDGFYLSNMDNNMMAISLDLAKQIMSEYDYEKENVPCKQIEISGKKYYSFYYYLPYSGAYYVRLISASSLPGATISSYIMVITLCFAILAAFIFFLLGIYRMVHKPLTYLAQSFTQVEQGDFTVQANVMTNSDFDYVFRGFNHMVSQLNTLIEQNYTQTVLLQKAELKQLQAQINPHFLYNSFFMLQKMIRWDPEKAEEIADTLARYFQYITRNSNDLVPLSAEYSHAKDYVYIQGLRFSERIQVNMEDFPENYGNLFVPKLILQPILENVFKHGLQNKESHGLVLISFHPGKDILKIIVEDNGDDLEENTLNLLSERLEQSKKPQFNEEMTGILNIQKRLILFSHSESPMRVFRSSLGGLAVEITLSVS